MGVGAEFVVSRRSIGLYGWGVIFVVSKKDWQLCRGNLLVWTAWRIGPCGWSLICCYMVVSLFVISEPFIYCMSLSPTVCLRLENYCGLKRNGRIALSSS